MRKRGRSLVISIAVSIVTIAMIIPYPVSGEVQPITEAEDKLESITEEERKVIEDLFQLSQEIDGLEQEEVQLNTEIAAMEEQIAVLEKEIQRKQEDYDQQLAILEAVLVNYQRGGPATYLEILLDAKNLSSFLKSLNIMKDISHNVNDLLTSLEESKKLHQMEKEKLDSDRLSLEQRKSELAAKLSEKQRVEEEQESYLTSLKTDREYYQEQLDNMTTLWEGCKTLFPSVSAEISGIIGAGYFALEDLNLDSGFFTMTGYIAEDTFNQILSEHSTITAITFRYEEGQVVMEVPEQHLALKGNFSISGKSAIKFEVTEGSFFDMPLEEASINELFQQGPLLIDFETITGDLIILDFKLTDVWSTEKALNFVIVPQF